MNGEVATHDVLITGARVVDGTGNPWFYGDIVFDGDRIADVTPRGRIDVATAREVVHAEGMIVCPGFIDIQSHSIVPFLTDRRSLSKVTQGVTTEIMGEAWTPAPFGGRMTQPFPEELLFYRFGAAMDEWNERARGWSRFGDWLQDLERRGISVNVGSFIGGSTVREFAMGYDLGAPVATELATMRDVLAGAMEDGAFGLATALIYPPGAFAATEELVALCEVVAAHQGVHITHVRSEGDLLLESIDEAITIAARSGASTEIYHLKAIGTRNWGKMPQAIARIEAARAADLDVTADMYPYEASATSLASRLPPWASAGGRLYEHLRDAGMLARIGEAMRHPSDEWEPLAVGPEQVLVAGLMRDEHAAYRGRSLAEIADDRDQDWVDALLDLLAAEGQPIFAVYFQMSEDNLALQMQQPWVSFATDAGGMDPAGARREGLQHPRAYGTYPRILGRYVRERGTLSMEDAIRKMSSAVADRLFLRDRGLLRRGMFADVVVFDPDVIADRATYLDPHQFSVGVREVWVNGTRVLRGGTHTGAMPGRRIAGRG
ncbi:MAG: N-acyl-D-amino-acid deacylase family protein [Thermomicrobiales bacterium]